MYLGYMNNAASTATTQCADLDAQVNLPSSDISSDPPTIEEVAKAIRNVKNGRAAGPDYIHPELLTCAVGPISSILHALFLKVFLWSSGLVPAEWRDGVIVSLYKGKAHEISVQVTVHCVQRHYSLSPEKSFLYVLLARIEPLLLAHRRPQQSGFTRGKSTMDAILDSSLIFTEHSQHRRQYFAGGYGPLQ